MKRILFPILFFIQSVSSAQLPNEITGFYLQCTNPDLAVYKFTVELHPAFTEDLSEQTFTICSPPIVGRSGISSIEVGVSEQSPLLEQLSSPNTVPFESYSGYFAVNFMPGVTDEFFNRTQNAIGDTLILAIDGQVVSYAEIRMGLPNGFKVSGMSPQKARLVRDLFNGA